MFGLASLILLGVFAQWLAWRLRVPSILLLLVLGFAVGPWTGHRLLDPDRLLGDALLPFVSLSVAVILFEGGLSLRLSELRGAGRAVAQLVLLGPPITFALATLAARHALGLEWSTAALLGAILIVTGPTVIVPLLRHVNPDQRVGRVVLWEGIVTDPIGAIMAVLVFEFVLGVGTPGDSALLGATRALLGGGLAGAGGAAAVVLLLRRNLVPDFLQVPAVLGLAVGAFVVADRVQHEAGLLAVTLMGVLLANQRRVSIEHVVEFKENLRTLLISTLFLLLAARVPAEEFTRFDTNAFVFLLLLILVVRPAAVFGSLAFSALSWRERAFVAWMAPRGIVAAAVTSVFALQLVAAGHPDGPRLVPLMFFVIVGTVLVYGLTAAPFARRLGIARGAPQGVLFIGAHGVARALAKSLHDAGVRVLLVDTNHHEVQAARLEGLPAHYGSALADDFRSRGPLDGLGHLVALTPNDNVNALACLAFTPLFGRANVHQVAPAGANGGRDDVAAHLRGRVAFGRTCDHHTLERRLRAGAVVKRTRLGERFDLAGFRAQHGTEAAPVVPLFLLAPDGSLTVLGDDTPVPSGANRTLFAVVGPAAASPPATPSAPEAAPA